MISGIGRHVLYNPRGAISEEQLAQWLRGAFETLARYGVGHGDLKLDNFYFVGDNGLGVMVVGLESDIIGRL